MDSTLRAADAKTIRTWDGLIIAWVVLWATLGVLTGVTIWQVAGAGDTITRSGGTLHSVGAGLQDLGKLPIIGERPRKLGEQVVLSADDISARGQDLKGSLRRLGLLLGIAILGVPATPVIGFYLPLRISRRREVKDIEEQLSEHPNEIDLDRYLAEHARAMLPYDVLARISTKPVSELSDAEARCLADAELARLGLLRPSGD